MVMSPMARLIMCNAHDNRSTLDTGNVCSLLPGDGHEYWEETRLLKVPQQSGFDASQLAVSIIVPFLMDRGLCAFGHIDYRVFRSHR
jgi:hypothetical protein